MPTSDDLLTSNLFRRSANFFSNAGLFPCILVMWPSLCSLVLVTALHRPKPSLLATETDVQYQYNQWAIHMYTNGIALFSWRSIYKSSYKSPACTSSRSIYNFSYNSNTHSQFHAFTFVILKIRIYLSSK